MPCGMKYFLIKVQTVDANLVLLALTTSAYLCNREHKYSSHKNFGVDIQYSTMTLMNKTRSHKCTNLSWLQERFWFGNVACCL